MFKIWEEIGIIVFVGLSYNKYLVKFVFDLYKFDGFLIIGKEEMFYVFEYMFVIKIFGVGKVFYKKLLVDGIFIIGDLWKWDFKVFVKFYGEIGICLYNLLWGCDICIIKLICVVKSILIEIIFSVDEVDFSCFLVILWNNCECLFKCVKEVGKVGNIFILKLKIIKFWFLIWSVMFYVFINLVFEFFE